MVPKGQLLRPFVAVFLEGFLVFQNRCPVVIRVVSQELLLDVAINGVLPGVIRHCRNVYSKVVVVVDKFNLLLSQPASI